MSFLNEHLQWPAYGQNEESKEIEDALQRQWLIDMPPEGIKANPYEPKISRAYKELKDLSKIIGEAPIEIFECYAKENDHQLSFTSRNFWEKHLFASHEW